MFRLSLLGTAAVHIAYGVGSCSCPLRSLSKLLSWGIYDVSDDVISLSWGTTLSGTTFSLSLVSLQLGVQTVRVSVFCLMASVLLVGTV